MVSPWLGIHSSACYHFFVMLLLKKVKACRSGSVNSKSAATEGEKVVYREVHPYKSSCSYCRGFTSLHIGWIVHYLWNHGLEKHIESQQQSSS